ncbi:MAG: hypothetical protein K2X93_23035 [Candidatus Obscuribacterales bacterium]|nr:hypothetical protein [Candidatus Obscuribacterales bacterium]
MRNQKNCDKCGEQIVFLKSSRSLQQIRTLAVDAATVEAGDEQYDPARHSMHFKSCNEPKERRAVQYGFGLSIFFLFMVAMMMTPACAAPEWVTDFENNHPVISTVTGIRLGHAFCFAVRHPKKFGKQCEEDGTNGLVNFVAGMSQMAVPPIVGAKKF